MDKTVLVSYEEGPRRIRMTITAGKPDGVMTTVGIKDTVYHLVGDARLKEQHDIMRGIGIGDEFTDAVKSQVGEILNIIGDGTG